MQPNRRIAQYRRLGIALLLPLLALMLAPWPATARDAPAAVAEVSPHLAAALAEQAGPVPLLVILRDQADPHAILAASGMPEAADAAARRAALYAALTAHAETTQAPLLAWLDEQGVPYRRHYMVNLVSVRGDAALVAQLQRRPEVARLAANPALNALAFTTAPVALGWEVTLRPAAAQETLYGLASIGAPELWARGIRGRGIVLAGQDTGVEWQHPALRAAYRGWDGQSATHDYHWFDAWANVFTTDPCFEVVGPCDDHGHGTHTVGTLLGETGDMVLGVAPEAQWMGCRNMLRGFGTPESYIACFEFFLAPYPQDGDPLRDGRPDLAPHIINNSWGCPPSEGCDAQSLAAVVETANAAGQLVVASAGNSGPGCSSVRDPIAIYADTFTVGSHGSGGTIASSSSRGPVLADGSGRLKPDLIAPGVGVYSAYRNGGYTSLSGTSMAAPHVAGGAALLWSAFPVLVGQPDLTKQLLIKSATPVPLTQCTGGDIPLHPNPVAGYGRLNLPAAWAMAQLPWRVAVEVNDALGRPLTGAVFEWIDEETGYRSSGATPYTGRAQLATVWQGRYTLRVTAGEETVNIGGIVLEGAGEVAGELAGTQLRVRYIAQMTPAPQQAHRYYFPWLGHP